ncbi:NAD-binding protein, partial [Rhodococcus sp. R1101]
MYVVVMGCGRVGSAVATALVRLGHEVAVIDRDESAFGRL